MKRRCIKNLLRFLSILAVVFVPHEVFAGNVPDWDSNSISYSLSWWVGYSVTAHIEEGGTYDLPLATRLSARYTWPGGLAYADVYKGTLHDATITSGHFIGGTGSHSNDFDAFPEEGDYFIIIYDVSDIPNSDELYIVRDWFETGNPDAHPPTHWGIINFAVGEKKQACCSSVLFLPGFQGSELYEKKLGQEKQVWPPNTFQTDIYALYLNEAGESINQIYTKPEGVLKSVGVSLFSFDIYRTFLEQLAGLEEAGTIDDHAVFPYDWRQSVTDIVEHGTPYNDGLHFPHEVVENLAAESKTGKVTIIGHSNGGLLAKALIQRLEREGKKDLVDKVILLATPQLGTPKTVASMLHGDFQNLPGWPGFLVSKANARALAENMPGAYGLLPSEPYFNIVSEPVIDVAKSPGMMMGGGLADTLADSFVELIQFLTGAGGREDPGYFETGIPNVLSSNLLDQANVLHQSLDSWIPPAGVEVIQIVGWGLDTPKNIVYEDVSRHICNKLTLLCSTATTTRHVVEMTIDGDGTVVSPSAAALGTTKTYYFDIFKHNKENTLRNDHGNITETQSFQDLFSLILATSSPKSLPQYLAEDLPAPSSDNRLRLRVLSPVSLDAYDSKSRHTGMAQNPIPDSDLLFKEENIPNSYFEEFGEGKYLGLPGDMDLTVKLKGLDLGIFTLEITPVIAGVPGHLFIYESIPVTASTTAKILVTSGTVSKNLVLDINGDGIFKTILSSSAETQDPLFYIALIKESIGTIDLSAAAKRQLLTKLTNLENLIRKNNQWDTYDDDGREEWIKDELHLVIIKKIEKTERYIQKLLKSKKSQLSPEQAEVLLSMLSYLETLVE